MEDIVIVARTPRKSIVRSNLSVSHFPDSGKAGLTAGFVWFFGGKRSELTDQCRIVKRTLLFKKRESRFSQNNVS